MNLSIEIVVLLLLASCIGVLLGALAIMVWNRRKSPDVAEPSDDESSEGQDELSRQEAQRFFLLNETGNVLISTSLSPTGRLPELTLELFSEALAHLSTVFYAVAGTKDPATGKPFSLYNYWALKRALEKHPSFIRVSTESTEQPESVTYGDIQKLDIDDLLMSQEIRMETLSGLEVSDDPGWLEKRVEASRNFLGMDDRPENMAKLQNIHSQLRAEAQRLGATRMRPPEGSADLVQPFRAQTLSFSGGIGDKLLAPTNWDKMEIGHIMLYCECLMGVSIVTVKLAHAHYDNYLKSEDMKQDSYIFVSTSQLKKTICDVSDFPQMEIH